jgi:hypothetical protein
MHAIASSSAGSCVAPSSLADTPPGLHPIGRNRKKKPSYRALPCTHLAKKKKLLHFAAYS